jgi:hypothetical protein
MKLGGQWFVTRRIGNMKLEIMCTASEPPAGLTLALAGLWWDAKGDWKRAHESAIHALDVK